jgi:hypothetical protein
MPSLSHIGPERPRLCRPSLKRDFLHQNRDHPAVSFIFSHAATLDIDTRGYSLWGSSAGARIAARIGSHGLQRFGGGNHPKPSTVVMAYTAQRSHINRASNLCRGRGRRRYCSTGDDGAPGCSPAFHRHPCRIPQVPGPHTRLRCGHRNQCRWMDRGSNQLLGKEHSVQRVEGGLAAGQRLGVTHELEALIDRVAQHVGQVVQVERAEVARLVLHAQRAEGPGQRCPWWAYAVLSCSNGLPTSRRTSVATCAYMAVVSSFLCPSRTWITRMSTFCSSK